MRETSHLAFQGSLSLEPEDHSVASSQSLTPSNIFIEESSNSLETEIIPEPASVLVLSDVQPDVEHESGPNTQTEHAEEETPATPESTNPGFEAIIQPIIDEGNDSDSSIVRDLREQLSKETIDSPIPNRDQVSSREQASTGLLPIEELDPISNKRIRKQVMRVLRDMHIGHRSGDSDLDSDDESDGSGDDSDRDTDRESESDMEIEVVEPAVEPNDANLKQAYPPKLFIIKESEVNKKWQNKQYKGNLKKAIDKLMKLIGLEEVKQQSLDLISKAKIAKRQGKNRMRDQRFNIVFQGNPGTGENIRLFRIEFPMLTIVLDR